MSKLNGWISLVVALGLVVAPVPGAVRAVWAMPVEAAGIAGESGSRRPRVGAAGCPGPVTDGSARSGAVAGGVTTTADPAAGDPLFETARRVRPATLAEVATFAPLAEASAPLAAARARLAPLAIDVGAPRLTGTTVGWVGVSFPIHGVLEGPGSQYALWFDAATSAVVAEAEFVSRPEGVDARVVLHGQVVIDERLDGDGPPSGGDFWECFRWCVGESLSHEVYVILRALCNKACVPVPNAWCELCMISLSVLEAGMISGCTHACMRNP